MTVPMRIRKKNQPHDRVYKNNIARLTKARKFLKTHMEPEIWNRIDWTTLEITDPSSIGRNFKQLHADVVYKALTQKTRSEVFFLLNHERKPQRSLPIRVLEYVLGTIRKVCKQKRGEPAFMYHLTFYNGKVKVYPYPKSISEYFAKEDRALAERLLVGGHKIINVHDYTDEVLSSHGEIAALELVMKHAPEPDFLSWLTSRPDLARQIAADEDVEHLVTYMAEVSHEQPEDILRIFEEVSPELKTNMLTAAERIRQEGRAEGMELGREAGIVLGREEGMELGREEGMELGREEGMELGREEGIQLRNVYVVQQMLEAGVPKDQISNFTGLTPTQIVQIAEQLGLI